MDDCGGAECGGDRAGEGGVSMADKIRASNRVLKAAYPAGPSTSDLATYRTVERAIATQADRMCAERCARAAGGKPCRGCNAVVHGWRDDAIAALKSAARLREAQAEGAAA